MRYDGKPFLRLLDCYVLKAIGKLDPSHEEGLRKMEAHFGQAFGAGGSWDKIVEREMDLPEAFPTFIREQWERNVAAARQQHAEVDPDEFVVSFVDHFFPGIASES